MRLSVDKPRIIRKETPPEMKGAKGYFKAREYLRRDFAYRCAYCMISESEAGGDEHFVIDHFQPRSKGGALNEYTNLYWVGGGCNKFKRDKWPTQDAISQGYRFADPCAEQDYGVHFIEREDGWLEYKTPCGQYHTEQIFLNRPNRLELRQMRNEKMSLLGETVSLLEYLHQELVRVMEKPPADDQRATVVLEKVEVVKDRIKSLEEELAIAIPFIPPLLTP
jgi:hypothetical protein